MLQKPGKTRTSRLPSDRFSLDIQTLRFLLLAVVTIAIAGLLIGSYVVVVARLHISARSSRGTEQPEFEQSSTSRQVPTSIDDHEAFVGTRVDETWQRHSAPRSLDNSTPPRGVTTDKTSHPLRFHPFQHSKYRIYKHPVLDLSLRCISSEICDGDISCGPDGLGCVHTAEEQQAAVRRAVAWSWAAYR